MFFKFLFYIGLFCVWLIWIGGFYLLMEDVWVWVGMNLLWEY